MLSSHDEFIKNIQKQNEEEKEQSRMTDEGLNLDIHLAFFSFERLKAI